MLCWQMQPVLNKEAENGSFEVVFVVFELAAPSKSHKLRIAESIKENSGHSVTL